MKTKYAIALFLAGMALTAQAMLYTFDYTSGFANGGVILDGNVAGWSDTRTLSGFGTDLSIQDVNVQLNISGGYNGDLYGYLVHESGFSVLLDRVGTGSGGEPQNMYGWSTSGFGSFTLDDTTALSDIHDAQNPAGGTYNSDQGQLALQNFNSMNPNGTWTLFLADMAAGDQSTLVSWGLDINAVPEPVTWALIGFGTLVGGANLGRWARRRLSRV